MFGKKKKAGISDMKSFAEAFFGEDQAEERKRHQRKEVDVRAYETTFKEFAQAVPETGTILRVRTNRDVPDAVFFARAGTEVKAEQAAKVLAALSPSGSLKIQADPITPISTTVVLESVDPGRTFLSGDRALSFYVSGQFAAELDAKMLSSPLDTLESGESRVNSAIATIERTSAYVVSSLFLPSRFEVQGKTIAVFWKKAVAGPPPSSGALSLEGKFTSGTTVYQVWYEFSTPKGTDPDGWLKTMGGALSPAWSKSIAMIAKLGAPVTVPSFSRGKPAESRPYTGDIVLECEIQLLGTSVPLSVRLPGTFVSLLFKLSRSKSRFLDGPAALPALFAANDALEGAWRNSFRSQLVRPFRVKTEKGTLETPDIPSFITILSRKDRAIFAQNYLIPTFGADELPYFFFCHEELVRNGKRALRPVALSPFSERDLIEILPSLVKEEWVNQRRHDLPKRTIARQNAISENVKALAGFWRQAVSNKVELSQGGMAILKAEVGDRLDKIAKAEMDTLVKQDVPFGFLSNIKGRELQRVLDSISTKDMAIAAVGDNAHDSVLKESMSNGRWRDFTEERSLAEARMGRNELDIQEITATKLGILRKMKDRLTEIRTETQAIA